jgi:hypothetical protein
VESNSSDERIKSIKEKLLLSKLLLTKYFILSPIAVNQLKNFPIVCCSIAVGGESSVDMENTTIIYKIKTKKFFKRNGVEIVPLSMIEAIAKKVLINDKKYKLECKQAVANLTAWSREILWGEDTVVKIEIDGEMVR